MHRIPLTALVLLASCATGRGPSDPSRTRADLEQACNLDQAEACLVLGDMALHGSGGPGDEERV